MRTAMHYNGPRSTGVKSRSLSAPLHAPKIEIRQQQPVIQRADRQRMLAAASDVDSPEKVQSISHGPDQKQMKQRIRSKVNSWRRPRTSNNPISVSFATDEQRAAALVLSDLSDTKPTRIVARSPEDIAKAISIIHTVSNKLASAEGNHKVLVFQPQQVFGVMVNPPDLPEGAQLLYTYPLPADNPVYQQTIEAYEETKSVITADVSWRLDISQKDSAFNAGRDLAGIIQAHGWAELNCIGGPVAVANGIKAITCARHELREAKTASSAVPDVAVVYQGFWKQRNQQELAQVAEITAKPELRFGKRLDDQQQERVANGAANGRVRQFDRINTFLVLGCAPNKPKQLVKLPVIGP